MNFKDIHSLHKKCLRWSVRRVSFMTFPLFGWVVAWYFDYYATWMVITSILLVVLRYVTSYLIYTNIRRYKFVWYQGCFTLAKYKFGKWKMYSISRMVECDAEMWNWTIQGRIYVYKVKKDDIVLVGSCKSVTFPRIFGKTFIERAKKEIINSRINSYVSGGGVK